MAKSSAMTTFNENVRRKLEEKGLTVKELAERIGMYREALSKILNGRVDTTIGNAERIAEGLEVPLYELITPKTSADRRSNKKPEAQAV